MGQLSEHQFLHQNRKGELLLINKHSGARILWQEFYYGPKMFNNNLSMTSILSALQNIINVL